MCGLAPLANCTPLIWHSGAWSSDPINNRLARRGTVMLGSFLCLVSNVGAGMSSTWLQLLCFRMMLGIGLGLDASTISVFQAECAPAQIRGGLAVQWQMWTAFGIFLGFVANTCFYNVGGSTACWEQKTDLKTVWRRCLEMATGSSFPPHGASPLHDLHMPRITGLAHQTREKIRPCIQVLEIPSKLRPCRSQGDLLVVPTRPDQGEITGPRIVLRGQGI